MKKTALLLLCTLVHTVLWSQVGIYKIDGDLEVTGDAQTDGNVNVGAAAPIGITTIHHPGTIGGNWGDGVTGFSEAALVLNNIKPDLSSNDMMALDSNQIISNSQLNIGSTDGLRFYAGGVSRYVVTDTGNFGIGTESPSHLLHIKSSASKPTLTVEATSFQDYNGGRIYLRAPSNDLDVGGTAIIQATGTSVGNYENSQFVIARLAHTGDGTTNILEYKYNIDQWRIKPAGVRTLEIKPGEVRAKAKIIAENGITVSNGLSSNAITLGGVTHTTWPASWPTSYAPMPDGSSNYDLFSTVTFDQNSQGVVVMGSTPSVTASTDVTLFGKNNLIEDSTASVVWGDTNEISGATMTTVFGGSNTSNANSSTVWGVGNNVSTYLVTTFGRYAVEYPTSSTSTWVATEPLLLVGNGTDAANRANALELLKNGNFKVSGTIQASKGVVLDNGAEAAAGAIRWTGTDFEGYDGTEWVSLTTPPDTGNGDISMGPFN